MAKALALDFTADGVRIMLDTVREDSEADLQAAVVNIATWQGSDALFATRGTLMHAAALSGSLYSIDNSRHAANFAVAATIEFLSNQGGNTINRLTLEPISFDNRRLRLDLRGYAGSTEIKFNVKL